MFSNLHEAYTGQLSEECALYMNADLTATRVIHESNNYMVIFDSVMSEVCDHMHEHDFHSVMMLLMRKMIQIFIPDSQPTSKLLHRGSEAQGNGPHMSVEVVVTIASTE